MLVTAIRLRSSSPALQVAASCFPSPLSSAQPVCSVKHALREGLLCGAPSGNHGGVFPAHLLIVRGPPPPSAFPHGWILSKHWEMFHKGLLESSHGCTTGWASSDVFIELRVVRKWTEDLQLPLGQWVGTAVGLTLSMTFLIPLDFNFPSAKFR